MLKASAVVTAALLSVRLSHIARGVCLITLVDAWQGWAMAVGIEAAYIVAELAVIFAATDKTRRQVARWAGPFTVVAMVMSALLNAFAFAEHVAGLAKAVPMLIGVMMPVAINTLTSSPSRSTSTATDKARHAKRELPAIGGDRATAGLHPSRGGAFRLPARRLAAGLRATAARCNGTAHCHDGAEAAPWSVPRREGVTASAGRP